MHQGPPHWDPGYGPSASGYQFSMAMKISEMASELRGMREDMRDDLRMLPCQIALHLAPHLERSTDATQPRQGSGPMEKVKAITKLLQILLAWGMLVAVVTGKVGWSEAFPSITGMMASWTG